jgi:hypothetical protein
VLRCKLYIILDIRLGRQCMPNVDALNCTNVCRNCIMSKGDTRAALQLIMSLAVIPGSDPIEVERLIIDRCPDPVRVSRHTLLQEVVQCTASC